MLSGLAFYCRYPTFIYIFFFVVIASCEFRLKAFPIHHCLQKLLDFFSPSPLYLCCCCFPRHGKLMSTKVPAQQILDPQYNFQQLISSSASHIKQKKKRKALIRLTKGPEKLASKQPLCAWVGEGLALKCGCACNLCSAQRKQFCQRKTREGAGRGSYSSSEVYLLYLVLHTGLKCRFICDYSVPTVRKQLMLLLLLLSISPMGCSSLPSPSTFAHSSVSTNTGSFQAPFQCLL